MSLFARRYFAIALLCAVSSLYAPRISSAQPIETSERRQTYAAPDYIRKPPELPPHLRNRSPRQMGLHEAIALVLQHNLNLSIQREEVRIADTARGLSLGRFEPNLQISLGRNKQQQPPATAQEGQAGQVLQNTSDNWGLRLSNQLPSGTLLNLDFSNIRTESTLGTAVAPRLFRSSLSFTVTQPILRGFSLSANVQLAQVIKAQFDSDGARQTARLRAMGIIKSTEDAYWSLVERWKGYEVNRGAYQLAEDQLVLTRRRIEAGVQPESELISAQATLAQRQVAVVISEAAIEEAADQLRQLINLPPAEWEQPLVPLDAPTFTELHVPFATAMERALASRPELRQAEIDLRKGAIDLEVARNNRLPQLNLQSSIGTVGQDADYARSLEQVANRSGWQWRVGMDLNWEPIGVATRADIRKQQSLLREKGMNREQTIITIRLDVRAALRNLETAERQLFAAARYRELTERSLEVEQRRFLNGMSENLKVAQRQEYLAQARQSEVQALIQHEKARTFLITAMGELLEARQIHFEVR